MVYTIPIYGGIMLTELPKLLPADFELSWEELDDLDLTDPKVQQMLQIIADEYKYNQALVEAIDMLYDWQWEAIANTAWAIVNGMISATQVGKSTTAMVVTTCLATGLYPREWRGRKYSRPVAIKVAGVDGTHNRNVLQKKLFGTNNKKIDKEMGTGMIPRDCIDFGSIVSNRGADIQECKILHVSGEYSDIAFKAYSQGREAAQGTPEDVYIIDEQPPDDFWGEALSRLATTEGFIMCTFTPLKGKTGLVETLLELPDVEDGPHDKYGAKRKADETWSMIRASWEDVTHISEKMKQTLTKGYAAYELEARTFGMPAAGEGRVYEWSDEEVTYDPREVHIKPEWEHQIGIDIGHTKKRDPSAVAMIAHDPDKDIYYLTDAVRKNTVETRELARLITGVSHTVPVVFPSDANKQSMNSPATVAEELLDMDINLTRKPFSNPRDAAGKKNNFKAPGINYINDLISQGRFKINVNCGELMEEFSNYQYIRVRKLDPNKVKLQDGKDDLMDAMRYAMMSIIQGLGGPLSSYQEHQEDEEDIFVNTY